MVTEPCPLAEAALIYTQHGWPVFPIKPRDKVPLTERGFKDATTDDAAIRTWWEQWPEANVGIATGAVSGLLVLDVDAKGDGEMRLIELEAKHGDLPKTVTARTGGGGWHYYFAHPGGTVKNRVGVRPGLDIRADGGYVVAPPSCHQGGGRYEWEGDGNGPPAPAPLWLLALINGEHDATRQTKLLPARVPEGQRNNTLASLAGTMRQRGAGVEAIVAALLAENAARCDPPLDEEEVRQIADSIASYEPGLSAHGQNLTDLGNARRLVERHGRELRYYDGAKSWLVWDGTRWRRDATREIERRAKDTVRAIYAEAAGVPDEDRRKAIAKWALNSEAERRIGAMIALARSEPGVTVIPDDLDADPWLLNVRNGTLDLRTGALQAHRPENLITKLAPVEYDPSAALPRWEHFLEDLTGGDDELRAFLQRCAGYTLTGDTSEEVLFFVHGPAASGKSTFLEALKRSLGEYAATADFETFLRRSFVGGIRGDVARLAGARLVTSIEVDEGKALAEGLIKQITGGDAVVAREIYSRDVEFRPAFKLWLAANHSPKVSDEDEAMWRRILRVPFDKPVAKEKRDPELKKLLTDPRRAGPAILAWMVAGCLAWQCEGLNTPSVVTRATAEYRQQMDPLSEFIEERCELDPEATISTADLWGAYEYWARRNGQRDHMSKNQFGERLRARGLEQHRTAQLRGWKGIKLLPHEQTSMLYPLSPVNPFGSPPMPKIILGSEESTTTKAG